MWEVGHGFCQGAGGDGKPQVCRNLSLATWPLTWDMQFVPVIRAW